MDEKEKLKKEKKEQRKLEKEKRQFEKAKEARVARRIVSSIAITVFLLLAGMLVGGYLYISSALEPVDPENTDSVSVEIPLGSGTSKIANLLEENGIIKDSTIFKFYVRFKNETDFQAGTYNLNQAMTLDEIIASLKTGKVFQEAVITIAIPEGLWLKDIASIIAKATGYTPEEVFNTLNDEDFIRTLMAEYPDILTEDIFQENVKYPLEGYLFPATYSYAEEKPPIEDIVKPMLDKTSAVLTEYLVDIERKGYTIHEVLTFASLIEEEAVTEEDRGTISSVFHNRLETGMPLQTDPTVIYAQGEHRDRLFYKDYEYEDPYSTYTNYGLPPGPIANPGESSIVASLYPPNSEYLYFIATKEGEVLFSKTLPEHEEKVRQYISN